MMTVTYETELMQHGGSPQGWLRGIVLALREWETHGFRPSDVLMSRTMAADVAHETHLLSAGALPCATVQPGAKHPTEIYGVPVRVVDGLEGWKIVTDTPWERG